MDQGGNPGGAVRSRLLAVTRPYGRAQTARSIVQLGVTFCLWAASYAAAHCLIGDWPLVGMSCAALAACFVVRLFMIQHDCGHRSFFTSSVANDRLGFWLGVITMTPYQCWRRFHAQHHAHSGNLDQRGVGDILTLTRHEYEALSPARQRWYRIYRHPVVMLLIGPPLLFVLRQRTTYKVPQAWRLERRSVHLTNLALVAGLLPLALLPEPWQALGLHLAMMSMAAIAGVWLFYVQHQFSEAYWEHAPRWESWRASMHGASYYRLPAPLRWLTANIGLHHIHHLDARIPNYRLFECFTGHPEFAEPPTLGIRDSLRCVRLRLWDEEQQRMVPIPAGGAR